MRIFVPPAGKVLEINNSGEAYPAKGYLFSWLDGVGKHQVRVFLNGDFDRDGTMYFKESLDPNWTGNPFSFTSWQASVTSQWNAFIGAAPGNAQPWYAKGIITPDATAWSQILSKTCHDNGWFKIEYRERAPGGNPNVYTTVGWLKVLGDASYPNPSTITKEGWILGSRFSDQNPWADSTAVKISPSGNQPGALNFSSELELKYNNGGGAATYQSSVVDLNYQRTLPAAGQF